MEYKQRRLSEPLIRHGKTVEDTEVKGRTGDFEMIAGMISGQAGAS